MRWRLLACFLFDLFFQLVFILAMAPTAPPKTYNDAVVMLAADQFPFGKDCKLDRNVQSIAFHYGLSLDSVKGLQKVELFDLLSFSCCRPDGNEDQRATYRVLVNVFESPIVQSKVSQMVRRIMREDPFAAIPVSESGESSKAAPKLPAVIDSKAVKRKALCDYGSSDDDDDDGDDDEDDDEGDDDDEAKTPKKKSAKTEKAPKDANSMIVELEDPVSFFSRPCLANLQGLVCILSPISNFAEVGEALENPSGSLSVASHLQLGLGRLCFDSRRPGQNN